MLDPPQIIASYSNSDGPSALGILRSTSDGSIIMILRVSEVGKGVELLIRPSGKYPYCCIPQRGVLEADVATR